VVNAKIVNVIKELPMRDLIIKKLEDYAGDAQWLKPLHLCTNEELLELYTHIVTTAARKAAIGCFM
jgi:hypothetical protein